MMGDSMMGDPGPSDLSVLPSLFGNQVNPGQVLPKSEGAHLDRPRAHFGVQERVPTSSTDLHPGPLPYFERVDQHPSTSFRHDVYEKWSHRTSELACGPSRRHRNWAEGHEHGRSPYSAGTLELMSRARAGEAGSSLTPSDDLFTYPEGEDGAVTITRRDLECLQPGRFLSDNIIDFYIKYLSLTLLSRENQKRFHFFNSFFFTKLLKSTTAMGSDQCKVDYKQIRKWIGDVNLFEKDYVFIPIIDREHWSLLVICHLTSLDPSSLGGPQGTPCTLHLDPIEGRHGCFEGPMQSLILQVWMERVRAFDNVDLLHALVQMKYVQAKVPQQENGYDCGLYILHYIEVFLSNSTSWDPTLSSCERGISFTKPNFKVEVFSKRHCIESLILRMLHVHNGSHLGLQPMPSKEIGLGHPKKHQQQGFPKRGKEIKSKKWKEEETLVLLECMVGGGRFMKGKHGAMHWDLIAEEINVKNNGGPLRSKEQCQNRFDTLLKAYKDLNAYCLRMGKEFCNVSEDEKRSLKLATPLGEKHEVWYNHLHTICVRRSSLKGNSYKRQKLNVDDVIDVSKCVLSPLHPSQQSPPPLDVLGSSKSMDPSSIQVVVEKFNALDLALRYTFFNLIQVFALEIVIGYISLEGFCRLLAIVQDQSPLEIRRHIYQLQDCKLVILYDVDFDVRSFGDAWLDHTWLEISNLEVSEKLGRKLLRKNPHLNTFYALLHNGVFAIEQCLLHQIRVLTLSGCEELENVDLGNFPSLRYLDTIHCAKLKVVNGWEGVKRLGWIRIWNCPFYCDLPNVQFLSSLKEFYFEGGFGGQSIPQQLANFNHCVQLRRLEICYIKNLVESMDLKALRFLEILSFEGCTILSTIQGLSGLQTLIKLNITLCESLERLPDLGCLKALTYLDMSWSGIVEIGGVEELHLLTRLRLYGCKSLESLPPLGHLKALAHLDLNKSSIEEIHGVEDLVSLETLDCSDSNLRQLPNLDHLCQLCEICIHNTPLSRMEPSRSFIGGYELIFNERKKEGLFIDDSSDLSDTNDFEDISIDEN